MSKPMVKQSKDRAFLDINVLEAARARIRRLFDSYDSVSVSFSGGKDSTACLYLVTEEAKRRGKKTRVLFFDEEAIHPPTVEYVERVSKRSDIEFEWYCLPFKLRNACSNKQPWWHPWLEEDRKKWVRDLPKTAITHHPLFSLDDDIPGFSRKICRRNEIAVIGIRTQESLRRLRICVKKVEDNYIFSDRSSAWAYPIYDWSSVDVWRLVRETGIDYNKAYDVLNRTRLHDKLLAQRVCPPFGDEPLRGLWKYAECWPDLWHKMLARVEGVATAWRYSNTELYGGTKKPDNLSWQEYTELLIDNYPVASDREKVRGSVKACLDAHFAKSDDQIDDERPHPLTGCSWKFLASVAIKGDFKRRQSQSMMAKGANGKYGISIESLKETYGKKRKKPKTD